VKTATAPTLELDDIQGGVLRGYGYAFATYALVRNVDRGGLAYLASQTTTAAPWKRGKPEVAVNVGLTAAGLEALGVPLDSFPYELRAGMASRSERLGDTGASAPAEWENGLRGDGHGQLLVWVQGKRSDAVRAKVDELLEALQGEEVVWRQDAAALPYGREHFGFADGFAQPSVTGAGLPNRPGEGVPRSLGRWRLLRAGELVLGYEDEDGVLPPAPLEPLHRNSTFMVLRKLHQDVAAWRCWLRDAAGDWAGGAEDWLAAKVVGRWADGTAVAMEPRRPQQRSVTGLWDTNDFRYSDDPVGNACPVGAHIRRTNPRDGLSGGSARTRRHRIVRRGMPYGPPLAGDTDDGAERGLLFACFNASIARQFETVQHWQADGNVFGLGPGNRDFMTGCGPGSQGFTIPGSPPVHVPGPGRPLVTVRGGEYLYVPSVSGLRAIAEGRVG